MSLSLILPLPSEHIEFTILNDFLGIDELVVMSMVNKQYYILSKRYIKKIYNIAKLITQSIIVKNRASLYSTSYFVIPNNTYDNEYWYGLFGKCFNRTELAIYYAHFITSYCMSGNNWCCVAYPDGFIKQLGSYSDGSVSLSPYKSEIYIRFLDYYDVNKLNYYMNCIHYEYNFKTKHKISIDENLLKKCVKYIFQNTIYNRSENVMNIKRPTIDETIEYLYPLVKD